MVILEAGMLVYTSSNLFGNAHACRSRDKRSERPLADVDSRPLSTTFLDLLLYYLV
jgi:hypothetical protein